MKEPMGFEEYGGEGHSSGLRSSRSSETLPAGCVHMTCSEIDALIAERDQLREMLGKALVAMERTYTGGAVYWSELKTLIPQVAAVLVKAKP